MNRLPDLPWREQPGLVAIVEALSDGDGAPLCRYVGGAVRDSLIGRAVSDVDLSTPLTPSEVIERLEKAGLKAVPTGIDHGTITAVAMGKGFEVTTLRRDISTDGRRATVSFSTDWRDDAGRRDFTINALYADPASGKVYDYFGGLEDLAEHRLRFIGEASERIAEDHLRILRFFRFLARFGDGVPDPDALAACRASANMLKSLSRERIADELLKILAVPDPADTIALMVENHIFESFLPEADIGATERMRQLVEREREWPTGADPLRRLLALISGPDGETVDAVARRLKMSNRNRKEMADIVASSVYLPAATREAAYRRSAAAARDAVLLYGDDRAVGMAHEHLSGWHVPEFPLAGRDLIERGVGEGPDVSRLLRQVESEWIANGFPDAPAVEAMADKAASRWLGRG